MPVTPSNIPTEQRERLRQTTQQLLRLHKLLLDRERGRYERTIGPISSASEFLNLVLENEWFEWLRHLSGLVVQIDELLAPRSTAKPSEANAAELAVKELLVPAEWGNAFQRKYWEAIQESPDILIAHREVMKGLEEGEGEPG